MLKYKNKIGLLVAMQMEAREIINGLSSVREENYKGITFTLGKRANKEIVVALAGIGKVNAAYTTAIMIERYGVNVIINTGIAGGVGQLKPLTPLAVTSTCQHDSNTTALGDPIGLVSGVNKVFFDTDTELAEIIKNSAQNAVLGRVATGDVFVADNVLAKNIASTFGAIACDMECCAVAQVCLLSGVKFGALKVISDSALDGAALTYEELSTKACEINASTLLCAIEKI